VTNRKTTKQPQLAKRVTREYEAIARAVETLERALSSPAPTRESAWRKQTRRDLASVVGLLQEHCESAEGVRGLLPEVERRAGRSRTLSEARRDHQQLPRDAASLLGMIDDDRKSALVDYKEVRERGWKLTARLRRHQAREADLLIELLDRDEGALD
jgi:hypothetical protein